MVRTQWEYKIEVNPGRPFPKHGRLTKWLYEIEPTDPKARKWSRENPIQAKTLSESLDDLGRDGWELVSVVMYNDSLLYYFKREIRQ